MSVSKESSTPTPDELPSAPYCKHCGDCNLRFFARCPFGILNLLLGVLYTVAVILYAFMDSFFGEFLVSTHLLIAFFIRAVLILCYVTNTQSMGIGYFTVVTEYLLAYFTIISGIASVPFMAKEMVLNVPIDQIFAISISIIMFIGILSALFHICMINRARKGKSIMSILFLFNTGNNFMTKKRFRKSQKFTVITV
ncbi:unnamed protein product [Bursaphelenchus okinawaensis]|uniref:Uncharacterized protein n=1 Tax=Bursaphelenchus okinawaensis TaxID=465554 RepID=A0A811K1S8_9BILA|nr:unnamed protein product [Bursaphelenchus okinawaensis]CAG9089688.1 unnamed protein product [Bursaphelenchus okinawaensis]